MPLVRKPSSGDPAAAATEPTLQRIRDDLASADEQVRWDAARAASGHGPFSDELARALATETSPRVRVAMFTSLAQTADAPAVAALQALLRSDDANLRIGALDALRLLVRDRPALVDALLADEDADIRILTCELARELPAARATALLVGLLRHESEPNVCAAAIDVLAEAGDASALPVLAECARRFAGTPFLGFAIDVAIQRLRAQTPRSRG